MGFFSLELPFQHNPTEWISRNCMVPTKIDFPLLKSSWRTTTMKTLEKPSPCEMLSRDNIHRTMQVGRDLMRSLVQPSAQNRVSYKASTGCLRLCPVRSWKPPRMELVQPHQSASIPSCLRWPFLLSSWNLQLASAEPLSLSQKAALKSLSPSLWYSLHRPEQAAMIAH